MHMRLWFYRGWRVESQLCFAAHRGFLHELEDWSASSIVQYGM